MIKIIHKIVYKILFRDKNLMITLSKISYIENVNKIYLAKSMIKCNLDVNVK